MRLAGKSSLESNLGDRSISADQFRACVVDSELSQVNSNRRTDAPTKLPAQVNGMDPCFCGQLRDCQRLSKAVMQLLRHGVPGGSVRDRQRSARPKAGRRPLISFCAQLRSCISEPTREDALR